MNTEDVPELDLNAPIKAPLDDTTEYVSGLSRPNRFVYVAGAVVFGLICLVVLGTWFFFATDFQNMAEVKTAPGKETLPTKSATQSFDRRLVAFEILDGTKNSEIGKKALEKLQGLGYSIATTNRLPPTKGTQLFLSSETMDYSQQIISDLRSLGVSSVSGTLTDSTMSARLIMGEN